MEWEGEYKDGHIHGFGTLKKYIGTKLQHTYVGDYNMGKREGAGTMTLSLEPNDAVYSGHMAARNFEGNFDETKLGWYQREIPALEA